MNEKQNLIHALERVPTNRWRDPAMGVLSRLDTVYSGTSGSVGVSSVNDLLRTYRIRHDSLKEKTVSSYGIEELLHSLQSLDPQDIIEVQPFLGGEMSVVAFWRGIDNLIGCITITKV